MPDIIYASAVHGPRPPTDSEQPRTGMEWAKWNRPSSPIRHHQVAQCISCCRPSARNHLSFVDDDCRAGPAPPSLFFLRPPRPSTYLNQIHAARKENERKMKENPHERAHHATTLTTTTTDERTNVTVHLSSSPFSPYPPNIFQSFH